MEGGKLSMKVANVEFVGRGENKARDRCGFLLYHRLGLLS